MMKMRSYPNESTTQTAYPLPGWRSTSFISSLLILGWVGVLYLLHQLTGTPFAPADLLAWLTVTLPGLVTTTGFLLTVSAALRPARCSIMWGNQSGFPAFITGR
jgi:hypothetical protein